MLEVLDGPIGSQEFCIGDLYSEQLECTDERIRNDDITYLVSESDPEALDSNPADPFQSSVEILIDKKLKADRNVIFYFPTDG